MESKSLTQEWKRMSEEVKKSRAEIERLDQLYYSDRKRLEDEIFCENLRIAVILKERMQENDNKRSLWDIHGRACKSKMADIEKRMKEVEKDVWGVAILKLSEIAPRRPRAWFWYHIQIQISQFIIASLTGHQILPAKAV